MQQPTDSSPTLAAALVASSTRLVAGVAPPDTYIPTYMPVVSSPKRECRLLPSSEQEVPRPVLIQEVGKRRSFSQRVRRWFRRRNAQYEDEQDGRLLLQ